MHGRKLQLASLKRLEKASSAEGSWSWHPARLLLSEEDPLGWRYPNEFRPHWTLTCSFCGAPTIVKMHGGQNLRMEQILGGRSHLRVQKKHTRARRTIDASIMIILWSVKVTALASTVDKTSQHACQRTHLPQTTERDSATSPILKI